MPAIASDTGANPEIGEKAAMEDRDRISEALRGSDMVFITAGMGGGTGTGSAHVVAEVARELGALTVAVVTCPFQFEGPKRARVAEEGLRKLEDKVDALIVVENQRLLSAMDRKVKLNDAFRVADRVLYHGVKGISDVINMSGLIHQLVFFHRNCVPGSQRTGEKIGLLIGIGPIRIFR